jgi:hypothetical protein
MKNKLKIKATDTDPVIEATRAAFTAQIISDVRAASALLEANPAFGEHAGRLEIAARAVEDDPTSILPQLELLIPVTDDTVRGLLRNAAACIARMPVQA